MGDDINNPRVEPEIGRSLERAREGMGLSLWQVEQETRIRSRYLRDLEREDFDVLPAVYVLGSLKTYADFLGLDGAALSRQLKARLVEPAEPDVPAQLATLGGTRDEDDEYGAASAPAVGFDHLFLGMGVILISILAIMTLAAAVAQGDRSPVSQIKQPSTPETPSEIALAGNVRDGDGAGQDEDDGRSKDENKEDRPEDEPEAPKSGEDGKDQDDGEAGDGLQAASAFDGVEFVPMSPSSSATATAGSAPSSSAPSSAAPETNAPAASASTSAPRAASVPADTTPGAAGMGTAGAGPAATGASNDPDPRGAGSGDPDSTSLAGGITDQVGDMVGPLR